MGTTDLTGNSYHQPEVMAHNQDVLLIIHRNSSEALNDLTRSLSQTEDILVLKYFLGIKIARSSKDSFYPRENMPWKS